MTEADNDFDKIYLANMNFSNGTGWLKVKKFYNDYRKIQEICFVRNEDGVHAWHCNSLPITDCRILEIKEMQEDKLPL